MKHLVIACFDGALATSITGLMDIFSLTGISWQRVMKEDVAPAFKVWLACENGAQVSCINRIVLKAHISFEAVMNSPGHDLPWAENEHDELLGIVVPTIGAEIIPTLAQNQPLLEFLAWGKAQNLLLAANCTGTFFLAEAGLLEGKPATTHWGYRELFEQRYPGVELNIEQLITQADNLFCAGGGLSWFDLGIYLIERELGYDAAIQIAKAFVIDYRRDSQTSYSLSRIKQKHHDELVSRVQAFVDDNLSASLELAILSEAFNISQRTLIRRFKLALGVTPHAYVQKVRLELAQKRLAETPRVPEQIMQELGYEDMSSFRRLFKRETGLTLAEYRRRFARRL